MLEGRSSPVCTTQDQHGYGKSRKTGSTKCERPEEGGTAGKGRGESMANEGNGHLRNTGLAIKFDINLDKAFY